MNHENQISFMHTYENLQDCRNYIAMLDLPAIVLCLFNGDRTLYTYCLQSSVDAMQETLTRVRATHVEKPQGPLFLGSIEQKEE
jgi:hypothetical protein